MMRTERERRKRGRHVSEEQQDVQERVARVTSLWKEFGRQPCGKNLTGESAGHGARMMALKQINAVWWRDRLALGLLEDPTNVSGWTGTCSRRGLGHCWHGMEMVTRN